jgi:UDP-N-acetylmuramate dehydrogenase
MVIEEKVPLSPFSTFRIGGNASVFIRASSVADIKEAEHYLRDTGNPLSVLGGGSNTLFGDEGFDGVVLKIEIPGIDVKEENDRVIAVVGAGVPWDAFVGEMVERGFSGLENLSGIPGSVGASPVQNIGAYGKEVASLIEWVEVFDRVTQKTRRLNSSLCHFGYRESIFKHPMGSSLVITRVAFHFDKKEALSTDYADLKEYFASRGGKVTAHDVREAILTIRAKKFPPLSQLGTAGSFFKNPVLSKEKAEGLKNSFPEIPLFPTSTGEVKTSAAWLIDHVANMKGYREGHARTFESQALVIVAEEGATARDVITLAKHVAEKVRAKTQIILEPEVRFVGCVWNV